MKALDLTNRVIGRLTVIHRVERPEHINYGGTWWRCQCACGAEISREGRVLDDALRRGRLSSCGCALSVAKSKGGRANAVDITGQIFGSLTVAQRTTRPEGATQRSVFYTCNCECGSEIVAHGGELRSGKRHHCGCRTTSRSRLSGDEAAKRRVLQIYRTSASTRDLLFGLTEDEFFNITSSACTYCGAPPVKKHIVKRRASEASVYHYNGIDRQDNDLGYMLENCVACCEQCNKAKRRMSVEEFRRWIARVYKHYVEGGAE